MRRHAALAGGGERQGMEGRCGVAVLGCAREKHGPGQCTESAEMYVTIFNGSGSALCPGCAPCSTRGCRNVAR